MKEFFARLNPMERRFVVGVAVAFFIVINAVWVLPLFGKWSDTRKAMDDARRKEALFEEGISHKPEVERAIAKYQDQNQVVPPEEQAVQFFRTIVNQSAASGVNIIQQGNMRQSLNTNNPYFIEQNQTIQTQSGEKQLVDFLYNIGASSNSLVRVKNLSIQPDPPHQQLSARITLVASYQKKLAGPGAPTPAPAAPKAAAPVTAAPKPAATAPKPPPAATPKLPVAPPKPPGPGGAVAPGAQARPGTPNPAGAPKLPANHPAATNKLSNLTPNKK